MHRTTTRLGEHKALTALIIVLYRGGGCAQPPSRGNAPKPTNVKSNFLRRQAGGKTLGARDG
jgi:hypothetical protein